MKQFVTKIQALYFHNKEDMSKNKKIETQEELEKFLKDPKVANDIFLNVMFVQEYENVGATSILSLNNRLKGHEKRIEQKEILKATSFVNYTKESILDLGLQIGMEFPNIHINQHYVPLTEAPEQVILDRDHTQFVGQIIMNPENRKFKVYTVPNVDIPVPKISYNTIFEGDYSQRVIENTGVASGEAQYYKGELKTEEGRKTQEHKDWLMTLFHYYLPYCQFDKSKDLAFLDKDGNFISDYVAKPDLDFAI